jgi:Ca-activated chloride channel family protein
VRGRIAVIALAVVAVVIAFAGSRAGSNRSKGGGQSSRDAQPQAGALRLQFVYSPEKAALIKPLVAAFNAAHVRAGGRVVFVDARNVASGDAEARIAAGRLQPAVWSPASSLWGRLLDFRADKNYVAEDNPSVARTPLVIAMWKPEAQALGWPRQRVGFKEILRLARSERGWAVIPGGAQFGAFKLGHTNPDFSTSGLSAVAGEYYAATGTREGLRLADVDRPAVRREIQATERSIVHYGDTTLFFEQQLAKYGMAYASAVAMEETTLIDFNSHPHAGPPLVALYPSDGAFYSDDPIAVLHAPWVTPQLRAAGEAFSRFIRRRATPQFVARFGFRPGDPNVAAVAPIDRGHGADPAQAKVRLALPAPEVVSHIKDLWHADRKPANVMLVVDTSGSMSQDNRLEHAEEGLGAFFRQLAPQDRVGLITFSSASKQVVPLGEFGENRARLADAVRRMTADGETAVFDAARQAVDGVRSLHDVSRINAVVLLTDGEDNKSRIGLDVLLGALRSQSPVEEGAVRVFTIAYGDAADRSPLQQIAAATGGRAATGDPSQIAAVYQGISSFF